MPGKNVYTDTHKVVLCDSQKTEAAQLDVDDKCMDKMRQSDMQWGIWTK